ncbi:MAG TPA: ATP-binding protein [Candidatus Limnocylindria bacterium]
MAELFEANRVIVLSVYGQVFFVLGLAIALQSLKRSDLPLARSLPWLAGFGIVHGFHEWGYLFVPIQSGYLPLPATEALLVVQLAIKGISFALLLQFGVELIAGVTRRPILPRLRLLPLATLAAWAGATLIVSAAVGSFVPQGGAWLQQGRIGEALAAVGAPVAVGDVLARWMLALPGSLLAAWGLLATARGVASAARPPVVTGLRIAAVAFAAYAVLGGLIALPAPFAPASWLNAASLERSAGVPVEVLRSVAGLVIAVAIILALDLFEQETDRALAEARRRELLARERERIGRDLHDGIIQSIYAAGLHLEEASAALGPEAEAPRGRISTVLAELERIGTEIRRTIFALRTSSPEDAAGLDAEAIVRGAAEELRANTLVALETAVSGEAIPQLSPEAADELRQLAHEAFSNILRHAHARHVRVHLQHSGGELRLEIADDGIGFDPGALPTGHSGQAAQGLANMRHRAEVLGGHLGVQSALGQGTTIRLTMATTALSRPR